MNLYLMRIRKSTVMLTILGSPPHQSFPFSKVSWKPWVGPGAGTPWRGGVARVRSVPVGTIDKVHSSLFQERRASGGAELGMRETEVTEVRDVGWQEWPLIRQGEQEGMPFTSALTQLPPSFSPGSAASQKTNKTKGLPINYQECEVKRTVR